MEWIKAVVLALRRIRGEMDIVPGRRVPVLVRSGTDLDKRRLADYERYVSELARVDNLATFDRGQPLPEAATALVGELELLIPLAGIIDKEAESSRLRRDIAKRKQEFERTQTKLLNPNFVNRAPAAVVAKERARAEELAISIAKLERQHERLLAL